MSLRTRFIAYLLLLHVTLAGLVVLLLVQSRLWLYAVEAVLLVSVVAGVQLVRRTFGTQGIERQGAQLLHDQDFTTRFQPIGQPEADRMIAVYNRMADHLREERTRLQEQQCFLSRIMTVSPLGIVTLDFDGRVDYLNPSAERLLHCESAEVRGKLIGELAAPIAGALAALPSGRAQVLSLASGRRVRCQRGEFVDRGFPRTFLLLEELTEELRQFEKAAYEKVIRMMSHEVNNSVAASNSLLESCLAYASFLPGEERTDFEGAMQIAIGRTEQLNRFMRSFADVVRLPPPMKRPAGVRELVESTASLMRAAASERRIRWVWEYGADPGRVPMDGGQMEQVFVNVFKNAMEAIGEDGTITVRFCRDNGRPSVVVEDTGPGIGPDVEANLFTPFFSTKEHGRGIGLTVIREILEQHAFDYSLTSADGRTRFTILF